MNEPQGRCPVCDDPRLQPEQAEGVGLQRCPACAGAWVEEEALARYVARALESPQLAGVFRKLLREALAADAPSTSTRSCPACQGPLERFGLGEAPFLIADRCAEHGLWLDEPDLEKVVRTVRSQAAVEGKLDLFGAKQSYTPSPEEPTATVWEEAGAMVCPNCARNYPVGEERCSVCNVLLFQG